MKSDELALHVGRWETTHEGFAKSATADDEPEMAMFHLSIVEHIRKLSDQLLKPKPESNNAKVSSN